jgi:hypothetical protein
MKNLVLHSSKYGIIHRGAGIVRGFSDEALEWMVWESFYNTQGRGKRFFSTPRVSTLIWDPTSFILNGCQGLFPMG